MDDEHAFTLSPMQFKRQRHFAVESLRLIGFAGRDLAHLMPVMIVMRVVKTKHSTVVNMASCMVDVGQAVSGHYDCHDFPFQKKVG